MNVENIKGIKEILYGYHKKEERDYNSSKNLVQDSTNPYQAAKENIESNLLDPAIEKILEDSPPPSEDEGNAATSAAGKKILEVNLPDDGSLEDIIKDLETTQSPVSPEKKTGNSRNSGGTKLGPNTLSSSFDTKDTSHDNSEFKKSNFSKLNENVISNSYTEQKNLRSCLSPQLLSTRNRGYSQKTTNYHPLGKKNRKTYRVYFFGTPLCLDIPICIDKSVKQVIEDIIQYCFLEPKFNKELIRYPENGEAYQLCHLDDEDDYLPDYSIPPLESQRVFSTFEIEKGIVLVENKGYVPEEKIGPKEVMTQIQQKHQIMIRIHSPEDELNQTFVLSLDKHVKDIYHLLAIQKKGINEKLYEIRVFDRTKNNFFNEEKSLPSDTLLRELDYSNCGMIELEMVKKECQDQPQNMFEKGKVAGLAAEDPQNGEDEVVLYNEVRASALEEFNVTIFGKKGNSKVRKLGIDRYKMYMSLPEKNKTSVLTSLFAGKQKIKYPEIHISDVGAYKYITADQGSIEFKIEIDDGYKNKKILFKAENSKKANQIISKLEFLKQDIQVRVK